MTLSTGARLGPYDIVAALGAGGMGEVYRARDPRLGREVALKVLPGTYAADAERLARFEQEARAAAALNHPNILAVYDIGTHENAPYIVSELLEGATLRESVAHLSTRKAIDYAIQVARGLAAAHGKGIVHRDLKPENIFITDEGRVKILDFGLAKLTQAEPVLTGMSALPTTPAIDPQARPQTMAGAVLGTVGYMAPEQVRGQAVDSRADIFSLGAILYEMLTGARAFRGETTIDTMTAILKEHPPDAPLTKRHVPPALGRIVDRCLEKSPVARFQTASDLGFALEGLSSLSAAMSAAKAPARASRVQRLAWPIAALIGIVATASATLFYVRAPQAEPASIRFSVFPAPGTAFGSGAPNPSQAVSPDGRRLVFTAGRRGYGSLALWIRDFDRVDARALPGTDGAFLPFWSPDSRFIAFFGDGKLRKIDVAGGSAQTICDAPAGEGGSWNADGVILFGNSSGGLFRVPASGEEPVPAIPLDTGRQETAQRHPRFLPDGRHFIYLSMPSNTIYVGALDSSETQALVPADSKAEYSRAGYLVFVRQGVLMAQAFDESALKTTGQAFTIAQPVGFSQAQSRGAFSVSDAGVLTHGAGVVEPPSRMMWFDRSGRVLDRAKTEPRPYRNLSLSPDEQQIVVSIAGDLWLEDVRRGVLSRFTADTAPEGDPIWSPDSRRVVYQSSQKGVPDLFVKELRGGEPKLLAASPEAKYPEDWSQDGLSIVYQTLQGSRFWILPLTGDGKPYVFLEGPFVKDEPHFSPDGKWIAYYSAESGRPEIYAQPFPGPGERVRVSIDGGSQPRWRKDGAELFFLSLDGKMMAVPLKTGMKLEPGTPAVLFQTPLADMQPNIDQYAVSADGQRFVVLAPEGEAPPSPITVVVNWTAALKK